MSVTKGATISDGRPAGRAALAGLLLLATLGLLGQRAAAAGAANEPELPAEVEAVGDATRHLDDAQLGSIVKDFGEHLKDTMEGEMERLINEVEFKPSASGLDGPRPLARPERQMMSESELERLRAANRAAGADIQARIELAGDNGGQLPQGLGSMATSFAAAASGRLSAAGSYIGNKMRALGSGLKARIPVKLRRFFKWPTFLRFKIRYHKAYGTLREELYRQMIFLRSHIVVGMQHIRFLMGRAKHLNGQNQYSDWTEREYHEREGNHQGERGASDVDASVAQTLTSQTRDKLESLAKSGKNIFGLATIKGHKQSRRKRRALDDDQAGQVDPFDPVDQVDGAEPEQQRNKRQRRSRRAAAAGASQHDDDDDDDDELNDDELNDSEDEDFELLELANDLEPEGADPDAELYKLVDEFANDLDTSGLDDLDGTLDNALNANDNFEPIDLRATGCVPRAENQNGCGCCYSYAIQAAASYYNCMEAKSAERRPDRYHARFVSDCGRYLTPADSKHPAVNGCRGGRISIAYKFAQLVGVQRFSYYNIARVSAQLTNTDDCVYPRPSDLAQHDWRAVIEPVPMFKRSRFTLLTMEEMDLHLRTVGPVMINVRTWKNFEHYDSGIVEHIDEAESSTLHSMVVVGHDRDAKGRDYWIILNSHGIAWGEDGYLRVYNDALEDFAVIRGGLAPLDL